VIVIGLVRLYTLINNSSKAIVVVATNKAVHVVDAHFCMVVNYNLKVQIRNA
jgi:hypothetical protein